MKKTLDLMPYFLILIFTILVNNFLFSQNEFIDLVNSRINNLKRDLNNKQNENRRLKSKIEELQLEAKSSKNKEKQLEDKIKEFYLIESELIKKETELNRLLNDLNLLKNTNNDLGKQIQDLETLKKNLSQKNEENSNYIIELKKELANNDQLLLHERAKNEALVRTIRNYDKKNRDIFSDMILFHDVGGRMGKTFSFHGLLGMPQGRRDNIYLGIGFGYDNYSIEDFDLSIIPLYGSIRWILNDSGFEYIIDDNGSFKMPNKNTPYFITEAGYSVALKNKNLDNQANLNNYFNSSGLLFNVGFGYMRSVNPFINLNFTATYNRQRFLRINDLGIILDSNDDAGIRMSIGIFINPK